MDTAIDKLTKFQMDRGLHKQPYSPENEHANIVEELLESVGFDVPKQNRDKLIVEWGKFIDLLDTKDVINYQESPDVNEEVDAYGDVIVFAVGAISKLGYDPEKVLIEIGKEINSRVGEMINGKFEKDTSPGARANWYKANFTYAGIEGADRLQKRRKAFFNAEGYMGSEEEVEKWFQSDAYELKRR